MMGLTPGAILLWANMVLEFGTMAERFAALCRQVNSGEIVTEEQLLAAKQATDQAVDEWDVAAGNDKENEDG